jgi:hypothetical protein
MKDENEKSLNEKYIVDAQKLIHLKFQKEFDKIKKEKSHVEIEKLKNNILKYIEYLNINNNNFKIFYKNLKTDFNNIIIEKEKEIENIKNNIINSIKFNNIDQLKKLYNNEKDNISIYFLNDISKLIKDEIDKLGKEIIEKINSFDNINNPSTQTKKTIEILYK